MNVPKTLAVTYGSYNAVRMLIGVYHAVFLLSTGVSLPQLALLQVIFSVTILTLDFPCAVLADKYHRKYSVVAGVVLTALFYPLCLQSPDMVYLAVSEVVYAAGICLITGAIDGWVYHSLENEKDRFSHYAHLCQKVNSFGSVITGIAGIATIYFSGNFATGYTISGLMMIVIALAFIATPEKNNLINEGNKNKSFIHNVQETLWIFKNTAGGSLFILLTCFFSAGIQIIFHFWQPIILSRQNTGHLDTTQLLVLMLCHIGAFSAQYVANAFMSRHHVSDHKYTKLIKHLSFIACIMCIALYGLVIAGQTYLAVIAFSLIHGFICTVPVGAKSLFFSELNDQQTSYVSGIVGAVSFSGRIFSVIVLSIISFLPEEIPPVSYLILPTVAFLLCGLVMVRWLSVIKKQFNEEVT